MKDKIIQRVKSYTLIISIIVAIVSSFFFKFKEIGVGVLIGSLCGILSLTLIENMCSNIDVNNAQKKAAFSYINRAGIIVAIFIIATLMNVSIIAMLIGFSISKILIVIVSLTNREEGADA